jgi:hypothetical protein
LPYNTRYFFEVVEFKKQYLIVNCKEVTMTQQFKKLNIDLPRQPLADQRVWAIAGWLLAAIVVGMIAISYISYLNS